MLLLCLAIAGCAPVKSLPEPQSTVTVVCDDKRDVIEALENRIKELESTCNPYLSQWHDCPDWVMDRWFGYSSDEYFE